MKLFYLFAAILILLSGVAAAIILQPISPVPTGKVTVIPLKEKPAGYAKAFPVKNKSTENRCGIRAI